MRSIAVVLCLAVWISACGPANVVEPEPAAVNDISGSTGDELVIDAQPVNDEQPAIVGSPAIVDPPATADDGGAAGEVVEEVSAPQAALKSEFVATDPATVALGDGQPRLIKFYAEW